MALVVTFFLALAATTVGYAWLGQGGAVAGMIFLAIVRVFKPSA
jgi:hypothetical protein